MGVVPLRMSEKLEQAVARVAEREGLDRSAALRRLLAAGLERYVADAYRDGRVTLRESADWLGVPLREAMDLLERLGAAGNLTREDVRAALEDVRNWR